METPENGGRRISWCRPFFIVVGIPPGTTILPSCR